MLEAFTFPLAFVGFLLLAAAAALAARGKCPAWLRLLSAGVTVAHIGFVWAFRYEWNLATATRNGYVGFTLFHTAFVLIVLATVLPRRGANLCLLLAFAVVCVGANGAVYRYEDVEIYRYPVHAITLVGAYFVYRGLLHGNSTPSAVE